MTDLRPYPDYRDSGFAWLGSIPAHWERAHGGAVLQQKNVSNRGMVENTVLSLSYGRIVIKPPEKLHGLVPESFETYQVVDPGDIIIRPTDLQNDWKTIRVGVVQDRGIITSAYICLRAREPLSAEFAHLLLLGYDLKKVFYGMGSGLRQNLDWSDFKRLPILLPSSDEQKAIVRFVRDMDKKVNHFVRNRRRLIEVLNEQKQAIINRAVTRGLALNVPFKPSGIDWLGDIPAHWNVLKLKRVARIDPSRSEAFAYRGSGEQVIFLPMERVSVDGEVDASERRPIREVWQGFTYFRRGDVVVAKITPCFENGKGACLDDLETEIGFGTTEFIVLRPSTGVSAQFLYQLTMLAEFRQLGVESMTGAAGQQRVSPDFVANFVAPIPPEPEQQEIVAFITTELARLRALIDHAKREMDLIREYRTRLIADVVTGKIDVRQATVANVVKQMRISANIHFRRSVFAAEIVHRLHAEPTFGHVKFEKLIFLCEKRCGVDTGSKYHRQAAGPYDNRALRSIDSQFTKQKWFQCRKNKKGYSYIPLEKAGGHKKYFERYFGDVSAQFNEIVSTFGKLDTQRCEIVATLYAAWEDLLAQGNVTDDHIIEQVIHHWHPSKKKIGEDRWRKALGWMKTKGLTPERG